MGVCCSGSNLRQRSFYLFPLRRILLGKHRYRALSWLDGLTLLGLTAAPARGFASLSGRRVCGIGPAVCATTLNGFTVHNEASTIAVAAVLAECFHQALTDPLTGHLHEPKGSNLSYLVLGAVATQTLG